MGNTFLDREAKKANLTNSHRRAPRQEKEVGERFKGFKTPASGAREVKGDVRVKGKLRIECKTTKNKSFSVTLDMLRKIEAAGLTAGELGLLFVEFTDGFGKKLGEFAVIPTYAIDDFIDRNQ